MHIHIYMCVYICIYKYVCVCVCVGLCVSVYLCECLCVSMYACAYVCLHCAHTQMCGVSRSRGRVTQSDVIMHVYILLQYTHVLTYASTR